MQSNKQSKPSKPPGSGFFSKLAPYLIGAGAFVAGWFAKEFISNQEDQQNDNESSVSDLEPFPPESKDWEFEGFTCPITQTLMQDPVVTRYGHSFERKAIQDWISRYQRCPLCNKQLTLDDLKPNYQLRHAIQQWVRMKKQEMEKMESSELESSKSSSYA